MTVLHEYFELVNGVRIPKIGLGTWQMTPEEAYESVKFGLEEGKYLHVDTAIAYENQWKVGDAIRDAAVDRDDIFIATKIQAETETYEDAKAEIEQSLEELKTDYIDLMLIHAPRPWEYIDRHWSDEEVQESDNDYIEENRAVWQAMVEAYDAGKLRAIGVSNFSASDIDDLVRDGAMMPHVNQVHYSITHTDPELHEFCKNRDILLEGYSPLGTGKLLNHPEIQKIADKYDRSVAQICIRYLLEHDILPLPKSKTPQYILENADVDFELDAEDVAFLDELQAD